MFVKLDNNEWVNFSMMERVWVDAEGRCEMMTPDGTKYRTTSSMEAATSSIQAYSEAEIVKEIQRAMTIRRKIPEG